MPFFNIDRALRGMRVADDGRVVGDRELNLRDIARHAEVPFDLVRAVFRQQTVPAVHDDATRKKLIDYLLSGAAKQRSPPEHREQLVKVAAELARGIETHRADAAKRADTLEARGSGTAVTLPAPATEGALAPPVPPAASGDRDAIATARHSLELAQAWRALREGELSAVLAGPPGEGAAWLRGSIEEGKLHIKALLDIRRSVRGKAGEQVRTGGGKVLRECEKFVGTLRKKAAEF